ncbi:MAG: DNA methyltransferase [Staphylococcus capitis]|nr:DNA cytosine methyltransferase [Staphylococcus capitis]PNZ78564.1 DNA methyltransferase [Staphylococcus capitis subsp. capitis]RYL12218.1 DNA methyltransferase [Staphylococcus sp. RIT622]MBC3069328.1 DNA cytosine methyltransferase [Staphylococcus capitis]MBO0370329.1 DNA cytosine methyltransferase [Staphylococcus capitis]
MIYSKGIFAKGFPIENVANKNRINSTTISEDIVEISDEFSFNFFNSGVMREGQLLTIDTIPKYEEPTPLRNIVEDVVTENHYLTDEQVNKFKYLRGPKKIKRTSKDGHEYFFSEGGMSETDSLDLPSRTMLTSEASVNRSTHFLKVNEIYRTLTPIEAERLNGFPDNWTDTMPDRMRYFCMGNALVVPVITRIANQIENIEINNQDNFSQLKLF